MMPPNQPLRVDVRKRDRSPASRRPLASRIMWGIVLALLATGLVMPQRTPSDQTPLPGAAKPPFDTDRAYNYLVKICELGPRVSGSPGMSRQQKLVAEHLAQHGAKVWMQTFDVSHPLTAEPVRMANLIATWHPEARERVLLACHYDTRPLPDREPDRRQIRAGTFLGANDGASGVALFMELAHHMQQLKCRYGVDFVLFDGEELVFREGDPYFLGSGHFAQNYKDEPPEHRYVYGVVVDMIGDRNLKIYMEKNSLRYAPELTRSLFAAARRLREDAFIPQARHEVQDDHLPLNKVAGIPTCDLIDFDFPHWHTTKDVPAACSGASLGKVGRVLQAWLADVPVPVKEK